MIEFEKSLVVQPDQIERAQRALTLVIRSQADEARATDDLRFATVILKKNEEARKELVKPLVDGKARIDETFKTAMEPFKRVKEYLSGILVDWRTAEAARIEAERVRVIKENAERERLANEAAEKERKQVEAQAAKEADEAGLNASEKADWIEESKAIVPEVVAVQERIPDAPLTTVHSTVGSVTYRKMWDFEIISNVEVPRTYCIPDPSLIREAVKAGVRDIPGVRIYEKTIAASGRNR